MAETRRTTSIARRINRSFLIRLIGVMFWMNLIFILLALGAWCYSVERNQLGARWTPALIRSLEWREGGSFFDRLATVDYLFARVDDGVKQRVSAGNYLQTLARLQLIFFAADFFILLAQQKKSKWQTERLLEPLQRMTETAEELSQMRFDERKYHELEDAIDAIRPGIAEARLETGDRELMGLETAVNNLLGRMHENYRQQIRFVSDASHELRTPISVVQGYADMLLRWGKNDEKVLQESLTAIRAEAGQMQKLVEQLLFLARGETGRQETRMMPTNLSELLREVQDEFSMIDHRHEWRVKGEEEILVWGDAALLKQAMRILCDNAAKYSAEGEKIILSAFRQDGAPCFCVEDAGTGIAPKDIPHIFERFYRSDPARARASGGTGLGLSIAKWIIDRHHGYFNILSREGVGTRIAVFLPPLSEAEAEAEEGAEKALPPFLP